MNDFFTVWWFHLLKKMSVPKHLKNKSGIVFFIEFLLIFTSYIFCSFNIIVSIHFFVFLCLSTHACMYLFYFYSTIHPSIHPSTFLSFVVSTGRSLSNRRFVSSFNSRQFMGIIFQTSTHNFHSLFLALPTVTCDIFSI